MSSHKTVIVRFAVASALLGVALAVLLPSGGELEPVEELGVDPAPGPRAATTGGERGHAAPLPRTADPAAALAQAARIPGFGGEGLPRQQADGSITLENPGTGLTARATEDGAVELGASPDDPTVVVKTRSVGRGASPALSGGQISRDGRVLAVEHGGGVVEQWNATDDGLEQRWIIANAPTGSGELRVEVNIAGADVVVVPVGLQIGSGPTALAAHLPRAWDAEGRDVPASYVDTNDGFAVVVDDDGATFPLTIDPEYYLPIWALSSSSEMAPLGRLVVADLNADGIDDVIVPVEVGDANVYYGRATGLSLWPDLTLAAPVDSLDDELFGVATSVGDVNGDGIDDMAIGCPSCRSGAGGYREGAVFLWLGSASGPSPTPFAIYEGNVGGALAGTSVAISGDVNGDGFDDVVIGAPGGRGRVSVYLGGPSGPGVLVHQTLTPVGGPCGSCSDANLGQVVYTADLNGDGIDDIVAHASELDGPDPTATTGAVGGYQFIYPGSALGVSATAASSRSLPPTSPTSGEKGTLYQTPVAAGDLNGDGLGDWYLPRSKRYWNGGAAYVESVIVQRSRANGTLAVDESAPILIYDALTGFAGFPGRADVDGKPGPEFVWGAPSNDPSTTIFPRTTPFTSVRWGPLGSPWSPERATVPLRGSDVGRSLAFGDFNGDGATDVVGSIVMYTPDSSRRYVVAVAWPNGFNPFGWTGTNYLPASGTAAASTAGPTGDIDHDGINDLYVLSGSTLTIWKGGTPGAAKVSLYTTTFPSTITATPPGGTCPGSVSFGDVDGDGWQDMVVGLPGAADGPTNEGAVRLLKGSSGSRFTLVSTFAAQGNQPAAYLGCRVTVAGDINGDGFKDILASAPNYDTGTGEEGIVLMYAGKSTGPSSLVPTSTLIGAANARLGAQLISGFDWNNDGKDDVAITNASGSLTGVYLGAAGGLSASAVNTVTGSSSVGSLWAQDMNGDGRDDLAILPSGAATSTGVRWYQGTTSTGNLVQATSWRGIPVGDVTGDGQNDAWRLREAATSTGAFVEDYTRWNQGPVAMDFGRSSGPIAPAEWYAPIVYEIAPGLPNGGAYSVGDVSGDGRADVVSVVDDGFVLLYGKPGGLSPCADDPAATWSCGVVDTDGDGVTDGQDAAPTNAFACRDADTDTCDDCSSGTDAPSKDGPDFDADGRCDAADPAPLQLTTSGPCPGVVTITIASAPAGAPITLYGNSDLGRSSVGGTVCASTRLGLAPPPTKVKQLNANPSGGVSFRLSVPQAYCSYKLQAVERTTCGASNIAEP